MNTPEDDEFDRIAKESGWRKQQVAKQASLQEKYDETVYLLFEAQRALRTCTTIDSDDTDKQGYYFNETAVEDALEIIAEFLKQNG
jgi:hypothetical protein